MQLKKTIKKVLKKQTKTQKYHKLFIYVIICNYGYGETIMKALKDYGSNSQQSCFGKGTAKKEVLNTLGFGSSNKNVIWAFVDETNIKAIAKYLDDYFVKNKKVMGIGFTMPVTSIVGEKVYHFLTNSL